MNSTRMNLVYSIGTLILLLAGNVHAQSVYVKSPYSWSPANFATYHVNDNLGPYSLAATQQQWENAIDSAATEWNYAGANFRFIKGSDVDYGPQFVPSSNVSQLGYYLQ